MTTREKVIEIIERMSEAEYVHLRQTAGGLADGGEFEEALEALAGISRHVNVSTDAAQLIRDERDWLARRAR